MSITTLEELFIAEISDVYNAEKQLTKALPKMAKAATDRRLAQGFLRHLEETEQQVVRIERAMQSAGLKLKRNKCEAMEGLIAAAQKVEHYEIASYGTLVELAHQLGFEDAADLLEETLEEETATDEKLTDLAQGGINEQALDVAA